MTISAHNVAQYFLAQISEECGDTISNLKLQKLLYYAQGFHLAITDKPLFTEHLRAWDHGPVVPSVYHEYKSHGAGAIPKPQGVDFSKFTKMTRGVLDDVYRVYGQFSAWKLRNLTHNEPPWADAGKDGVISRDSLRSYFRTQIITND